VVLHTVDTTFLYIPILDTFTFFFVLVFVFVGWFRMAYFGLGCLTGKREARTAGSGSGVSTPSALERRMNSGSRLDRLNDRR
jgi:hypothetical protein